MYTKSLVGEERKCHKKAKEEMPNPTAPASKTWMAPSAVI